MNFPSFSAASVSLAIFLAFASLGRAQEGPARAYSQATSRPLAAHAQVAIHGAAWIPAPRPVAIPAPRPWSLGHREVLHERVWIPGAVSRVWVPPIHETRRDWCGRIYQVQVAPGYWQTVQEPGHYEWRSRRVWRHGSPDRCD